MSVPRLSDLGDGLLDTTASRRWLELALPYIGVALFALCAWRGWWRPTPLVVFGTFVAVVTATHDVAHRSIGLGRRASEWALFVLGLVLLESGHAYRVTHMQHHRLFPSEDDPEGYPANLSLIGAICYGPFFLPRLLTVYLPHRDYGDTPLTQTHTLRGRVVPSIFLELTYHLEHHLYPQVPSHRLPELARRLDPFFDQAGVRPWRVI